MRILVADDDLIFRTLMVSILADGGYEVVEAEDGRGAWELLQSEPFDFAVIDVNMPELDGAELLRMMRADPRFAYLPVLVLTIGFAAEELVSRYDPACTDYLTKPFETGALLEKVRDMEGRMMNKPAHGG